MASLRFTFSKSDPQEKEHGLYGLETILKGGLLKKQDFCWPKFVRIWNEILASSLNQPKFTLFSRPPFNIVSMPNKTYSFAWGSDFEKVSLKDSVGRISVEMVCPYPPGIPLLIPGEILDEARVDWLIEQKCFWPEQIPDFIRVIS